MTKNRTTITALAVFTYVLAACTDTPPDDLDLSLVSEIDKSFYTVRYNQCNINNSRYDCNCVANIELDQRNTAYDVYKAAYETTHKPALEHDIETLEATIVEKSKNASDERIIESLEDDLRRLKYNLERGVDDKDNFTPPPLIPGSTDVCIIEK